MDEIVTKANSNPHLDEKIQLSRRSFNRNIFRALAAAWLSGNSLPLRASIPSSKTLLSDKVWSYREDKHLKAIIPQQCTLKIVAQSGLRPLAKSAYSWHGAPDGGACFSSSDNGWVYVSNAELKNNTGGAGALAFNKYGELINSYSILRGTSRNCSGGKTPWNTWLSCEEQGDSSLVYECDPFGQQSALARPALGRFNHEAVAVDLKTGRLYLTEDMPDGCLYRFTPSKAENLSSGLLELAIPHENSSSQVGWQALPDPTGKSIATRFQLKQALKFNGGEGIAYQDDTIVFTTKGDNRVWSLDTDSDTLSIIYDQKTHPNPILSGVDNVEFSPTGEVLIAEDGGDMQIVVLGNQGDLVPLVTLLDHQFSEVTGPAFSPDGSRLYFSSQRGKSFLKNQGYTYELMLNGLF